MGQTVPRVLPQACKRQSVWYLEEQSPAASLHNVRGRSLRDRRGKLRTPCDPPPSRFKGGLEDVVLIEVGSVGVGVSTLMTCLK
jgi:hypothetical protein